MEKEDIMMKDIIKHLGNEKINLIVIGLSMIKKDISYCKETLKSSNEKIKIEFIDNENVLKFKKILRINGIIRENERMFINERYNSKLNNF